MGDKWYYWSVIHEAETGVPQVQDQSWFVEY